MKKASAEGRDDLLSLTAELYQLDAKQEEPGDGSK
jgi:hypothetical protein